MANFFKLKDSILYFTECTILSNLLATAR
jgi:hypothetical protein